jgi:hypothetical protein
MLKIVDGRKLVTEADKVILLLLLLLLLVKGKVFPLQALEDPEG